MEGCLFSGALVSQWLDQRIYKSVRPCVLACRLPRRKGSGKKEKRPCCWDVFHTVAVTGQFVGVVTS
jgi:hypothetical protein